MHTGAGNATNAAGAEMHAIASSIIGGTAAYRRCRQCGRHIVWSSHLDNDQIDRDYFGTQGSLVAEYHHRSYALLFHPVTECCAEPTGAKAVLNIVLTKTSWLAQTNIG